VPDHPRLGFDKKKNAPSEKEKSLGRFILAIPLKNDLISGTVFVGKRDSMVYCC
jgi:hypothetical protein